MRNIFLFMMVSMDGFIEGPDHDLSWHHVDDEFNVFAAKQMDEAETILFGRNTYQLMESFWPSKEGREGDPEVAEKMNTMPKVVVSHSLPTVNETPFWKNASLIKENIVEELQKLKKQPGKPIVVLGSNNLCVTLLKEGLLDEVRIMVNPVAIGKGTTLFEGIDRSIQFNLLNTRTFQNGNILLSYQPR